MKEKTQRFSKTSKNKYFGISKRSPIDGIEGIPPPAGERLLDLSKSSPEKVLAKAGGAHLHERFYL